MNEICMWKLQPSNIYAKNNVINRKKKAFTRRLECWKGIPLHPGICYYDSPLISIETQDFVFKIVTLFVWGEYVLTNRILPIYELFKCLVYFFIGNKHKTM